MADVEELLKEGKTIQFAPLGYSMFPLFDPRKGDMAIVEPLADQRVKRGDVIVYRRKGSGGRDAALIIHRVWKVKEDGYYFVGDNQVETEGPILREQMLGRLTARDRGGKILRVCSPVYFLSTRIWLFLRPFRNILTRPFVHYKSKK